MKHEKSNFPFLVKQTYCGMILSGFLADEYIDNDAIIVTLIRRKCKGVKGDKHESRLPSMSFLLFTSPYLTFIIALLLIKITLLCEPIYILMYTVIYTDSVTFLAFCWNR